VQALDHVNLSFKRGEVHAQMGENGAGKSTLIKIIAGAILPDSGKIVLNGAQFDHMTTRISRDLGIAIIYQELSMVPELSVAENIFLGEAVRKGIMIDQREMVNRTAEIFKEMGVSVNPQQRVGNLTTGYQQMVEIARALSKNAKILVMDEPSSSLTDEETRIMLDLVIKLKKNGVTIIYISHRIEEVFVIADRISVLRDGEFIATVNAKETTKSQLIHLMVGRDMNETFPNKHSEIGAIGMEIRNFTGNGVKDISLKIHHGEILGLGGLVGAGRTELAQLIYGAAHLDSGDLLLEGEKVVISTPKQAVERKIGLIPEERKTQGLLLDFTIKENISLPSLPYISRLLMINRRKEQEMSSSLQKQLGIKTPSLMQKTKNLSGGNQQKVVLAKWLAAQCDYLIFDEPTRGIDVGAKQEIYKLLHQLAAEGKCILMISSEMEELIGISDRIIVLCEGRQMGEIEKKDFNQDLILTLASGN
jgi:ABC-type sugar transport system ATPase subunit